MNERDEPFEKLKFGKETVELTPNNTSLYRHLGAAALCDHVFVHWPIPETEPPLERHGYVWADHPKFARLVELAILNSIPQHLNLPEVSDFDFNNYCKHHSKDLDKPIDFEA